MSETRKYILDANIFIEAKRRYYAFDLCPGFWQSLLQQYQQGNLESIDRVKMELSEGDDLNDWKKKAADLFVATDSSSVLTAYADIIQWAQTQGRFNDAAKSEFAGGVDAWVIAYAKANNGIVVTHEVSAPKSKKNVKMPDVCEYVGVQYANTFAMLRQLEVAFILHG